MPESSPAPALPPVPRWERIAAGVLAAVWVWLMVALEVFPGVFLEGVPAWLSEIESGWHAFISEPSIDLSRLAGSLPILGAIGSGLVLALICTAPFVVLGALTVAAGRLRRHSRLVVWWLAVGQSICAVIALSVLGRYFALSYSEVESLNAWHRGWLSALVRERSRFVTGPLAIVPFQFFLAAFVLGVDARRRRREGEAPAEPK